MLMRTHHLDGFLFVVKRTGCRCIVVDSQDIRILKRQMDGLRRCTHIGLNGDSIGSQTKIQAVQRLDFVEDPHGGESHDRMTYRSADACVTEAPANHLPLFPIMPRGKNYVNNNRGVFLKTSSKKTKSNNMETCFYGAACTRKDCIYAHPSKRNVEQSHDPCLAYLAGICPHTKDSCTKRHPGIDEKQRLVQQYRRRLCMHGSDCRTNGCLFGHPTEEQQTPPVVLAAAVEYYQPPAVVAVGGVLARTSCLRKEEIKPRKPSNNSLNVQAKEFKPSFM